MATSSITEPFYLDEKACDRYIEIMEDSNKKVDTRDFPDVREYEEGRRLLIKYLSR